MAHKLDSQTICDLLENLIGNTEPVADYAKDYIIQENLMMLIDVLNWCLDGIYFAAKHNHSQYNSERLVGERAYAVLDEIEKWCHKKVEYTVNAINDGWAIFGAALYCPECSKTWIDRNPGRPMPGERNTFLVIMNRILQERDERNGKM